MESYYYHNIFETKGLEYLLTIGFFLLLIPFWLLLNKRVEVKKTMQRTLKVISIHNLKLPQGILHHRNHIWMHLYKSGIARIGLDEVLLAITGEVVVKPQIEAESYIKAGDLIAEIIQNDKRMNVFSPVSGVVKQFNSVTATEASVLLADPYGEGWLFEIKPTNWLAETRNCLLAEHVNGYASAELVRLKDFIASSLSQLANPNPVPVLQEGGELREHFLSDLPQPVWFDFQQAFLQNRNA